MKQDNSSDPIHQLLEALSCGDKDGVDSATEALNIHYSAMPAPELYEQTLHAHAVIFKGTKEQIDKSVQKLCKSDAVAEKLRYLSREMRNSLADMLRPADEDHVVEKIYNLIGEHREDHNHIWEALFTAAAIQKEKGKDAFSQRLDEFFTKFDEFHKTQDEKLGDWLEVEEVNFLQEPVPNRYEFLLRHTAWTMDSDRDFVDFAVQLKCGSESLEDKHAYLGSIYHKKTFCDKMDKILFNARVFLADQIPMRFAPTHPGPNVMQ